MKLGIIGLPESGKSTIFNLLTNLNVELHSYTQAKEIKPNIGVVSIPDNRLDELGAIFKSKKITHASIYLVDMVGITKNLALEDIDLVPIKDTFGFICVVRDFYDEAISHPYGKLDYLADLKIIECELILLDLHSTEKRIEKIHREIQKGVRDNLKELELLKRCQPFLSKEVALRDITFTDAEDKLIRGFQFLSKKPLLVIVNRGEDRVKEELSEDFKEFCKKKNLYYISVCAKVESEVMQIEDGELKESFLSDLGISQVAREKIIFLLYSILEQIVFFTTKGEEAKAWMIRKGTTAHEAAGKIHSDIQKGFIKAEVINFNDFVACGRDMHQAKASAKVHLEGKDYVVQDGDIIDFRFNL